MDESNTSGVSRREVLGGLALALCAVRPLDVAAAGFPDRPLRLIVPYPAGGSTDIVGRLIGKNLSDLLGKPVVIDNRSGAAGAIGSAEAAHAPADGYTLVVHIVTTAVINPLIRKDLSYDPIRDFQPVAMVAKLPNVLIINKDIPATNFQEFVAWARANPARATYGTGGVGSIMHLTGELLKRKAGFDMIHVPYRGAAPAIQDVMAGSIAAVLDNVTGVMGPIRSGAVRAIGVTTEQRVPTLPDVPTLAEGGLPGFVNSSWIAVFTRAGVPPDRLNQLEAAVLQANTRPDLVAMLNELGAVPASMGAAELDQFWKDEFTYWRQAVGGTAL